MNWLDFLTSDMWSDLARGSSPLAITGKKNNHLLYLASGKKS